MSNLFWQNFRNRKSLQSFDSNEAQAKHGDAREGKSNIAFLPIVVVLTPNINYRTLDYFSKVNLLSASGPVYYTFFSHHNELHIWRRYMLQLQYVAHLSQHVGPHAGGAHMLWETSGIPWIIMAYPFNYTWLPRTIHETHIYVRKMYKTSDNKIISHNIL